MRNPGAGVLQIPCNTGIDQSGGDLSAIGAFENVENLRCNRKGGLRKRRSLTSRAQSNNDETRSLIVGNGSTSHLKRPSFAGMSGNVDILGTSEGQVFAWDETGDVWALAGKFGTVQPLCTHSPIFGSKSASPPGTPGFGDRPASVAVNSSGYILVCAQSDDALTAVCYIESPEGTRLWNAEIASKVVKAIAVGSALIIVLQESGSAVVQGIRLSITGSVVSVGALANLATMSATTDAWDVDGATATLFYLFYRSAATTLKLESFAVSTLTSSANVTFSCSNSYTPVSLWVNQDSSNDLWVGWYDDYAGVGTVAYRTYATGPGSIYGVGTNTIVAAPNVYGPPLFGVARSSAANMGGEAGHAVGIIRYQETTGTCSVGTLVAGCPRGVNAASVYNTIYHALPLSKPDEYGRFWAYLDNAAGNSDFARLVMLRVADIFIQASVNCPPTIELTEQLSVRFGPRGPMATAGGTEHRMMYFTKQAKKAFGATEDGKRYCALPKVLMQDVALATMVSGQQIYEYFSNYERTGNANVSLVRCGNFAVCAGTPTQVWYRAGSQFRQATTDTGKSAEGCAEIGFAQQPVITGIAATAGSALDPGSYEYVAVYIGVDDYGNRHFSRPSDPVTVPVSSATNLTVTVTAPQVTQRDSELSSMIVMVQVYRTLKNGTTHMATTRSVYGGTGIDTLDIVDSYSDATIVDNEVLYTDGGVLAYDVAPSCRWLVASEDRLWALGGWRRDIIQCSKTIVPYEQPAFTDHDSHKVVIPENVTGGAYMDGAVVVFCDSAIYAVNGQGPDDRGQGSFSTPQRVASGIGCMDGQHGSILQTPIGIIFRDRLGFYLLPRGLGQPIYIGEKVHDLLQTIPDETDPTVCDSTLQIDSRERLARFLIGTSASDIGGNTVLNFDLETGQWTKDTFSAAVITPGAIGQWSGTPAYLNYSLTSASSSIYVDSTVYNTESGHVRGTIKTKPFHPFGFGMYGKVRSVLVEFNCKAQANLRMSVWTDNNTEQIGSWDIAVTGIGYREVQVTQGDCSVLQVQVQDYAGDSEGEPSQGLEFIALVIDTENDGKKRILAAEERA